MKKFYISIISIFFLCQAMSQNALPDPGFGNNGVVRTGFPSGNIYYYNEAKKVLAAPDGTSFVLLRSNGEAFITHLNANGSIDLGYGDNGYSVPVMMEAFDAVLQSDGKVVAAGFSYTGIGSVFTLARYNSDGSLDAGFDGDGKVQTPFLYNGTNSYAFAQSVTLQTDGKIVAAGYSQTSTGNTFTLTRYNSDGSLDSDFDGDGKVQTPFLYNGTNSDAYVRSVAIQSDGKIVAAGQSYNGTGYDFTLTRYNSNGSLDSDFDGDGKVQTPFIVNGTSYASAQSVVIQSDGKIVVSGNSNIIINNGSVPVFTLARYNSDGSLDAGFDGDGKVQTPFIYNGNTTAAYTLSLAIQSDGKIVAAGYSNIPGGIAFTLAHYNSDGSLDAGFDGDGKVQTTFNYSGTNSYAFAQSVAIQSDGKIVAAGYSYSGTGYPFTLARYNSDGSLDSDFDGDGKLTGFINNSYAYFNSTTVQSDGMIVAAGYSQTASGNVFTLARYSSDGSLDVGFDGDGKVQTPFLFNGTNSDAYARSVAIQGDGKIVAAGFSYNSTGYAFTLARYNSDGSLDTDFDGDGMVQTPFNFSGTNSSAYAQSLSIQSDGKIVAAGYSYNGTGWEFALARYNSDGSLDVGFDGDGKVQTPFIYSGTNSSAFVQSVAIQSDGKVVAAGYSYTVNGYAFTLARYNTDGSLDASFDGDGNVQTPFIYNGTNSYAVAQSVSIQSDGKIVAVGQSETGTGSDFTLARYNSDGSLDAGFDGDGKVQTPFIYNGTNSSAVALSVSIQSDGKIVAAGFSYNGTGNAFTLARYNSDGSLDAGFYTGGKSQTSIDNFNIASGTTIKENKVYIPGSSRYYGEVGALAAILLDGSIAIQLSCPGNIVVSTDVNLCTAIINDIDAIFTPTGSTAAYTFTLTGATTDEGEGSASGKTFNKGVTTVTYTLANDNTKTCSFTITVEDKVKPTITAPAEISVNNDPGLCYATVNLVIPVTGDNCGVQGVSNDAPVNFPVGTTTVIWTVTDLHGNTETATQTVTVTDNEKPVVVTKDIPVQLNSSGTASITAASVDNGSADNCDIQDISVSPAIFNCTNFGINTVTLTVTDIHGNVQTKTAEVNITAMSTTSSVTVTPSTRQYSDKVTFAAELTPGTATGGCQAATNVTFTVGTKVVGTVPLVLQGNKLVGSLVAALFETIGTSHFSPGNKTVTASFTGVNQAFAVNSATTSLTITKEDARVNYTGALFAGTACTSCSNATVTLSATVQDITATPDASGDVDNGDIRLAKVRFINRDNNAPISGWLTVGLVNGSDIKTGAVTYNWSVNIGTADADNFTVGIEVDNGYYYRNNSDDNVLVTVSKPLNDFATGGGFIITTASNGQYASDPGSKNNFGFNVRYNKTGKNLLGKLNFIIRRTESDGKLHIYQIKGNSMTSLSVNSQNPAARKAIFNGKANMQDITNPLGPVSLGGNLTLQVEMTDRGEPGNTDSYALTVWNSAGGIAYSSNWVTNRTTEMTLSRGNIMVRGAVSPITTQTSSALTPAGNNRNLSVTDGSLNLQVKVLPNPSQNYFQLNITGNGKGTLYLRVTDQLGRVLEDKKMDGMIQQVKVGENWRNGTYILEVIQGEERKTIQLVKLN